MTDYTKDIEIIEAASEGPWGLSQSGYCGSAVYTVTPQYTDRGAMSEANARHIAHFDPLKCRELIETIQRLEKKVKELEVKSKCDDVRLAICGFW